MNPSLDLLHLTARAAEAAASHIRAAGRPRVGLDDEDGEDGRTKASRPHRPSVQPSNWISKGHNDWVSEVDRTAESLIAEVLQTGAPGSRVMGEEHSPEAGVEGMVWIVDPLDGTTNFLHGYPQYAVSIGLAIDGALEVGVVLDVNRECLYGAMRGGGAWLGNTPLRVSEITDPARALLGTGYPFKRLEKLDEYLEQFRRILPATSGVRRAGSAALDLADVAAGRLDGFWELVLAPWDTAAGMLLIREAGGVITDRLGRPAGITHGEIVAGNPAIHAWLLTQLGQP
jgi:myo-inositol-1(or 4)-monophosphatase